MFRARTVRQTKRSAIRALTGETLSSGVVVISSPPSSQRAPVLNTTPEGTNNKARSRGKLEGESLTRDGEGTVYRSARPTRDLTGTFFLLSFPFLDSRQVSQL